MLLQFEFGSNSISILDAFLIRIRFELAELALFKQGHVKYTAIILILKLFANLPNRILISNGATTELKSNRIRTKFEPVPKNLKIIK